ncbi:hypothetical protein DRE_02804 [Drechslerella stenobrocha 248]|uniref:Uncharacterized protein n=1 Tax=Drechslerella stenobrocha 248 TaxID=1043628 RepID=W7I618_9PEZI|nr:hypothetical protein DRE_02804 [Drechslerella stenobrocha 248]
MPFAITPMTMEYLQDLDYESVVQPATRVYFPLQATFAESEAIFSSPMPSLFEPRPVISSYLSGGSWTRPSTMELPDYLMADPAMQIVKKRRHQSKLDGRETFFAPTTSSECDDGMLLKPDFTPETSARRAYTKNRTSFIEITAFQVPICPSNRSTTPSSISSSDKEVPIPHTPEQELPDDISPEFSSFSSVSSGTFSNVDDLEDFEDVPSLDAYKIEHHDSCPIKVYLESNSADSLQGDRDYFSSRCICSQAAPIQSKPTDWMNLSWDNSPPTKTGHPFMNGFKAEPKIFSPGYPEVENMELGSF